MAKDQDEQPKKRVVIVGAGIVGVATAYFLAKSGRAVTCIERHGDVAQEASHLNGGLLCPSLTYPWTNTQAFSFIMRSIYSPSTSPVRLHSHVFFDLEFWRWNLFFLRNLPKKTFKECFVASYQLSAYSKAEMSKLQIPESDYRRGAKGSISLYSSVESREAAFQDIDECIGKLGADLQFFNADQCIAREPVLATTVIPVSAALYSSSDSSGDISRFTTLLSNKCKALGVQFRFNTSVSSINIDSSSQRVTSMTLESGEKIEADDFINAAGNGAPMLAKLVGDILPSYPVKGYCWELPVGKGFQPLQHNVVDDFLKVYASPVTKGGGRPACVRLSGIAEFKGLCREPNPELSRIVLENAQKFFPAGYLDANSPDAVEYTCLRPQTPDDLPIIGRSPRLKNLWYNAGHGHLGWTRGTGSAIILTNLMDGRPSDIDSAPFSPLRFAPLWRRAISAITRPSE
eukprot:NODE_1936_length_1557_cov_115.778940_g1843_i0.p1 GENE.NODE_1936_length_1557_cov_115.778940_g1843_i0~~NODE_1936_length_1557_cov_115.778940_g1843_i0.p1  ORF type:complete len:459 (-),score=45.14 NODE_1936_length_1557_cov_115.778940_g1843_i0:111-1487(-)